MFPLGHKITVSVNATLHSGKEIYLFIFINYLLYESHIKMSCIVDHKHKT